MKISKEEVFVGIVLGSLAYLIVSNSSKKNKTTSSTVKGILNSDKYNQFSSDTLTNAIKFEPLAFGPYVWKGPSGMPIDIYFKSTQPIFTKPSDGSTYCTGYTFSVAFVSCLNRGLLNDFTDDDIRKMQSVWNVGDAKTYPKLCVDAISKPLSSNLQPLGKEISLENAQPGDFCQIWRTSGSGHSVIVVDLIKKDNKITGIKYYSSNGTVNPTLKKTGPGENTEYFSDSGGKMIRNNTYFARLNK